KTAERPRNSEQARYAPGKRPKRRDVSESARAELRRASESKVRPARPHAEFRCTSPRFARTRKRPQEPSAAFLPISKGTFPNIFHKRTNNLHVFRKQALPPPCNSI